MTKIAVSIYFIPIKNLQSLPNKKLSKQKSIRDGIVLVL